MLSRKRGNKMNLKLIPVTAANRALAESLEVYPDQVTFIETVKECMEEADNLALWHPVIIEDNQQAIGFSMYGYFKNENGGRLWMDRLLIDKHYQAHGYGKHAIKVIIEQMLSEYPNNDVYLSVYDDNPHAIDLYHFYGFEFNGELDTKGEKIMVRPYGTAFPVLD